MIKSTSIIFHTIMKNMDSQNTHTDITSMEITHFITFGHGRKKIKEKGIAAIGACQG